MIFAYLVERRNWVIGSFFCALVVTGWGLTKLTIDPNNRVFFSSEHPKYADLIRLEDTFGSNTELVYVLYSEGGLAGSDELTTAVRWLTNNAWGIEGVRSVASLANYPFVIADKDDLSVVNALDFACDDSGTCDSERVKEISPLYLENRLIAADHTAVAVVARVDIEGRSDRGVLEIASQASSLKSSVESQYAGVKVFLTGGVPMMEAFFVAAKRDSETLMPIALATMFVVLAIFLGSLVRALTITLLGIASVVMTMGLAGWAGFTLNTATATAPLVIFTLVVVGAMHLLVHVSASVADNSDKQIASRVIEAVKANVVPMFLTTVTTAIGFGTMVSVSAPPIGQLGLMAACGVVIGAFVSLFVMPSLFVTFPSLMDAKNVLRLEAALDRYAKSFEKERSRLLVPGLVVVACVTGIVGIRFDEDFVRYFSADTSFRADTEEISRLMAGPYHIDVMYDSGEAGGLFRSDAIRDMEAIAGHFRKDDRVVNVLSYVDVLKRISDTFTEGQTLKQADPEELAQFFLTYELSLDRGQSVADLVDPEQRYARVSILLRDISMGQIRDLVETAERWAPDHVKQGAVSVTGEGVPTAYLSGESISEMSWGIATGMLIDGLIIAFLLRSVSIFAVVFLATVIPLLAGFGIWGWFEGEIGMAATLVISTTIGVVVDDTIHIAYRYLEARRLYGEAPWGAAAYSLRKAGPAVVVTSIGLSAGFLVLVFSDFQMNRTFGICSSLVIILALIYNLSVSPRLLRAIG